MQALGTSIRWLGQDPDFTGHLAEKGWLVYFNFIEGIAVLMLISERPRCWGTYVVQTFPFKFGIHLPTPRIEMHPYVILICTERSLHWVVETYESDMLGQSDPVFLRINLLYSPNFTIMLVDERGCISLYMVLQWCMHAGDKHITYRC